MLKIKDNIDLKELDKYGFIETHKKRNFYYKLINEYFFCNGLFKNLIFIIIDLDDNKKIKKLIVSIEPETNCVFEEKIKRCSKTLIKDLIQAGLVDKEEKK